MKLSWFNLLQIVSGILLLIFAPHAMTEVYGLYGFFLAIAAGVCAGSAIASGAFFMRKNHGH